MASYGFDDMASGSAIGGAASGAAAGSAFGPWGAAIGGVLGGVGGSFANYSRDKAVENQKSGIDQIIANMKAYNSTSYDQHIADLQKALSFYAPAQAAYDSAFGTKTAPAPKVGQGSWANTGFGAK